MCIAELPDAQKKEDEEAADRRLVAAYMLHPQEDDPVADLAFLESILEEPW